MKKVIVLGCVGMAGHIMAEHLDATREFEVFGIAKGPGNFVFRQLDVLNFELLRKAIEEIRPDYVVNCIGVLVSKSNSDVSTAILLNSYLPNFLSALGKAIGFKLIHLSTDCVFSGKDGHYGESSFRDGDDNYARSKALGEIVNDRDLTIRTSIIGPELKKNGIGLLDWFFKQSGEIKGYTKAYWSGVTTLELAKATYELIRQDIVGLIQVCPDSKISKYDLLRLASNVWNKKISILPYDGYKVDKSLICTRKDFNYVVPGYEKMLLDTRVWMDEHADYYSHYNL